MLQLVIALLVAAIGLMGSAAGVEWLRRRDSGESVKTGIEVWAKLPDSVAKDQLLARIERRVNDLGRPRPTPLIYQYKWIIPAIGALTALLIGEAVQTFAGSHTWQRHPDGILWMHDSRGTYTTFTHWLGWTIIGMPAGYSLILFVVAPFVLDTAIPWMSAKLGRSKTEPDDEESTDRRRKPDTPG